MKPDSGKSSRAGVNRLLKLTLQYRIPSLNVMLRRHWSWYHKERQKADNALACAFVPIASDPLTPTILREVANRYLMHCETEGSPRTIIPKRSRSLSSSRKSHLTPGNGPKSK